MDDGSRLLSQGDLHGRFSRKDQDDTVAKAIRAGGTRAIQLDQHTLWKVFQCDGSDNLVRELASYI